MSRVEKAREAFLSGNMPALKKAHSPEVIRHAIHEEKHVKGFNLPEVILGGQDGLVNVLGIILGVAVATASKDIVIVAGLAAAFAESISMAAVAYTSKIAEADYYQSEYERERYEIEHFPEGEKQEIRELYRKYGFKGELLEKVTETITANKEVWLKVMMDEELRLEPVDRKTALTRGVIVGISAVIGSFIPLTPFFFLSTATAVWVGIVFSAVTLFLVGYYKAKKTIGRQFVKQGIEMMLIGMVSAFIGFLIGSLLKVNPV